MDRTAENGPQKAPTPASSSPFGDTQLSRVDSTIRHPGSVKINVQGASIVDGPPSPPNGLAGQEDGIHYETKDIRLPNHTAVVSHIAVDVRTT